MALAGKLEYAHTVVNELVEVYREYGITYDYNRDKAYAKDIAMELEKEASAAAEKHKPSRGFERSVRKTGQGASNFDHDSQGMKTGKLNNDYSKSQTTEQF